MGKVSDVDISIIVQGPVVETTDKTERCTDKLLKSIRRWFPGGQIVLSTWRGENVKGLDYDVLVQSEPPEAVQIIYSEKLHLFTINHQLISTFEGLKKAERKYAIKIRSDLIFLNANILNFLERYHETGKKYSEWKLLYRRIVTLPTYNYRRGMPYPFSVADWIYAGLKEDMMDFFDIPAFDIQKIKIRPGKQYPYLSDNIGAEQYNCVSFIKKHIPQFDFWGWECKDPKYLRLSEIYYAQNFVFIPAQKLGVTSQKLGDSAYCARPMLSSGLYTFAEWKQLYNRYGGGNLRILYNPVEDIGYAIVLSLRRFTQLRFKRIYNLMIEKIRKRRRKR